MPGPDYSEWNNGSPWRYDGVTANMTPEQKKNFYNTFGDMLDPQSREALNAMDLQKQVYDSSSANFKPYLNAGRGSLADMLQMVNGGYDTRSLQSDPGYQFRMQQGQQALERSAAARGGLGSGAFAKGLDRYSQGIASDEFGNRYNRLSGIAGMGFNAANSLGSLGSNYANAQSSLYGAYGNAAAAAQAKNEAGIAAGFNNFTSLAGMAGGYGGGGGMGGMSGMMSMGGGMGGGGAGGGGAGIGGGAGGGAWSNPGNYSLGSDYNRIPTQGGY